MSTLGYCYQRPHAGLRRAERTVEVTTSVSPMSLASLLFKAVKLESAEFPQQRAQAKSRPGLDGLSFLSKLLPGLIPKQNKKKKKTPVVFLAHFCKTS